VKTLAPMQAIAQKYRPSQLPATVNAFNFGTLSLGL
jgi:hypothetical protein